MTTYSDLIEETRHHLMTAQPDRVNVLHNSIDDTETTLTLRHGGKGVGEGTRLAIGLEEFHVVEATTTGATSSVTVVRGFAGSTATAHNEDELVYVNPQFSDYRIGKFINQGLDNLSSEGLFYIKSQTVLYGVNTLGYNLEATDFLDVWRVRYDQPGNNNVWQVLRPDEYYVDLDADTDDFPAGIQIVLRDGGRPGWPVRISYRASFSPLAVLSDDVLAVSHLHQEAHDLPSLYAAICLLAGREIKRSFLNRQPEPRRQEEVPPGAANQSMRPLLERYYGRVDNESRRLKKLYPKAV